MKYKDKWKNLENFFSEIKLEESRGGGETDEQFFVEFRDGAE